MYFFFQLRHAIFYIFFDFYIFFLKSILCKCWCCKQILLTWFLILQILISCEKKIDCSEICCILRALYQAVVPSSVELEKERAKSVVFDMIPCFKLCIDYAQRSFSCSDLVKNEFFPILYHIIRTFLKVVSIFSFIYSYIFFLNI